MHELRMQVSLLLLTQLIMVSTTILTKPEWGITYEDTGDLYEGVTRYYIVAALEIPQFSFPSLHKVRFQEIVCGNFSEFRDSEYYVKTLCDELIPEFNRVLRFSEEYRQGIQELIEVRIPGMLPSYKLENFKYRLAEHEVREGYDNIPELNEKSKVTNTEEANSYFAENPLRPLGRTTDSVKILEEPELIRPSTKPHVNYFDMSSKYNPVRKIITMTPAPVEESVIKPISSSPIGKPSRPYKIGSKQFQTEFDTFDNQEHTRNEFYHNQQIDQDQERQERIRERTEGHRKRRRKRFIFAALQTIINGVNTGLAIRKEVVMEKAVRVLKNRQKVLENRMIHIKGEMFSLANITLKGFETLQQEYKDLITHMKGVQQHMKAEMRRFREKVNNGFRFMAYILDRILELMGTRQVLLQEIKREVLEFMNALDSLARGYLTHSIIPPYRLKEILNAVSYNLEENFPDLEIIMKNLYEYYNMKLITFDTVQNNIITIQIPILLKEKGSEPFHLYKVNSLYVPYNLDGSENTQKAYTRIKLESELLGVHPYGKDYLSLDAENIENCFKIDTKYYCETSLMIKNRGYDSCAKVIYTDEPQHIIKERCDFKYFYNIEPKPQVIVGKTEVLIANLPLPWTFDCKDGVNQNNIVSGPPYAVLKRNIFCSCSMESDNYVIHQGNLNCVDSLMPYSISYQSNAALYLGFGKRIPVDPQHWKGIPTNVHFIHPIIKYKENHIISDLGTEEYDIDLDKHMYDMEEVMQALRTQTSIGMQNQELGGNYDNDINQDGDEIADWFRDRKTGLITLFWGFILTIIMTVIVLIIIYVLTRHNSQLHGLGNNLRNMLALPVMAKSATANTADFAAGIIRLSWLDLLIMTGMILTVIAILWIVYNIIKRIYQKMHIVMWDATPATLHACHMYFLFDSQLYGQEKLYIGSGMGFPTSYYLVGELEISRLQFREERFKSYIKVDWVKPQELILFRGDTIMCPDKFIKVPILRASVFRRMLMDRALHLTLIIKHQDCCWRIPIYKTKPHFVTKLNIDKPTMQTSVVHEESDSDKGVQPGVSRVPRVTVAKPLRRTKSRLIPRSFPTNTTLTEVDYDSDSDEISIHQDTNIP